MARLNTSLSTRASVARASTRDSSVFRESSLYAERTPTPLQERHRFTQASPTPGPSSDKENRGHTPQPDKSTRGTMGPPSTLPTPGSDAEQTPRASKRRRLGDRAPSVASTAATDGEGRIHVVNDMEYYDPDQDPDQRREVRKDMRSVIRDLNDRKDNLSTDEWVELIERENALMTKVKQTSDATIDSRFLVSASDTILKRTTALLLGDAATGIDIDEFVSKCITFMQSERTLGSNEQLPSTQMRGRRHAPHGNYQSDDDDAEDDGDALAWDVLGQQACFPTNHRAPVPGFLLGPLSVQKRVRATQTQRRQRLQRDPNTEKRPDTLKPQDLQRNENSNVSSVVKNLRERLKDVLESRMDRLEEELNAEDADESDEDMTAAMKRHGIVQLGDEANNIAMSLLEWIINPASYGQTVENLFYTSFLIRDGTVGIAKDDKGLPVLYPSEARGVNEQREQHAKKHQAVLSIDWPTWKTFIQVLGLQGKDPIIPNRNNEQATQAVRGWYG